MDIQIQIFFGTSLFLSCLNTIKPRQVQGYLATKKRVDCVGANEKILRNFSQTFRYWWLWLLSHKKTKFSLRNHRNICFYWLFHFHHLQFLTHRNVFPKKRFRHILRWLNFPNSLRSIKCLSNSCWWTLLMSEQIFLSKVEIFPWITLSRAR